MDPNGQDEKALEEALEDALMWRVMGGDTDSFRRIVQRHQARLVRVAGRLLGDADAGQDAAQEAFLRLWRLREHYEPRGCLRGYLLRIVRTVCLDYRRAARPELPLDEGDGAVSPGPETLALGAGLAEAVAQAVQSLPEMQRAVFVLSHYENLSYAEIAAILDCPVGTVASRKHQAVAALRRKLNAWREEI